MNEILTGPAGSPRSETIFSRMRELAEKRKKSVLIVPENMSHTAERRLLEQGNAVSRYARVTTFSHLTDELLSRSTRKTETLDEGGRVLSMYRAVSSVLPLLRHYRGTALRPHLVSAMLSTAEEFITSKIDPVKCLKVSETLSDKLYDIALIYSEYLNVCRSTKLDPGNRIDLAAEYIAESGYFDEAFVFIDGFSGFSAQKLAFLDKVLAVCEGMTVSLLLNGDRVLFYEQYRTQERLKQMGERRKKPFCVTELPAKSRSAELDLCEKLFDMKAPVYGKEPQRVHICACASQKEECELCAAQIRRLTVFSDVRLREIAVTSGNMDAYAHTLEGFFVKYGIPAFFSRNESILKKPVIAASLGALDALCAELRLDSTLSYIKNGFSELSQDEIYRLENYALMWNIRGNAWLSPFTKNTNGYDAPPDDEAEKIAYLNAAREKAVAPIIALKTAFSGITDGGELAAAFEKTLDESGLDEKIDLKTDELFALGKTQECEEYAQLYEILKGALAQMREVLSGIDLDISEFYRLLSLTLAQYDVSSIPTSLDSITAAPLTDINAHGIKHLFVLGACDGVLPPAVPSKSILTEQERDELKKSDLELQTDEEKACSQLSDIYNAFNAPSCSLNVYYPLVSDGGDALMPSYVITRLKKLFPKIKTENAAAQLPALRLTAKAPAFELACSGIAAKTPENLAAYAYFEPKKPEFFAFLKNYAQNPRSGIKKPESIRALYGDRIYVSASRLDDINNCRFKYFCKSGLCLNERKRFEFSAANVGTMLHDMLEHAIPELCKNGGNPHETALSVCDEYIKSKLSDATDERTRVLIERIRRSSLDIIDDVWEEIQNSSFKPEYFEIKFGDKPGNAPAFRWEQDGFTCILNGTADRVDRFENKLKIVDYKSFVKKFTLSDLLNGINLQPFIYMLLLKNAGIGEGCAALYIPITADYAQPKEPFDESSIESAKNGQIKRIGIIRSEEEIVSALEHFESSPKWLPLELKKDGTPKANQPAVNKSEMEAVAGFTESKVREAVKSVISGDTSVDPFKESCRFCPYRTACHFDKTTGDFYRKTENKSFSEALSIIISEGGNEQ